jgi:hypothetical protein
MSCNRTKAATQRISSAVLLAAVAVATVSFVAPLASKSQEPRRTDAGADVDSKGLNRPPRKSPAGPMGPGGPGFGPGTFLAPQIVTAADKNEDGRLTPAEAAEAARRFVRDADTDRKGSVDALVLGRAINRHIGPPGFGPDGPPGAPDGPGDDFGPGTF